MKLFSYQALREELASAERRAEEERAAHNASKMVSIHKIHCLYLFLCLFFSQVVFYCNNYFLNKQAAMEREVELEHRALDASTALARIQVLYQHTFVTHYKQCYTIQAYIRTYIAFPASLFLYSYMGIKLE